MSPLISLRFLQRQSDDKLVALARAGNERAFETLVRRYRRPLLVYARRLSGSEARAEDALQQALLQAWIALCANAKPNDVRPWLFRIVHNVVVNSLRRQQHPCVELDEALDTAERVASADLRIECREALSGLAALPELQRRAMVLTAFGGNSHGEVAATLGLTDGAVRGLVYRARAALRSAAALIPLPIARWAANRSPRRTPVLERTGELLGGAGSAGAGGVLLKGGAAAATIGAIATATFVPALPTQQHAHPRTGSIAAARTREEASRLSGSSETRSNGAISRVASAGSTRSGETVNLGLAVGSRAVGSRRDRSGSGDGRSGSSGSSGSSGRDGGGRSGDGGTRSGGGGGSVSGGGDRNGPSTSSSGDGSNRSGSTSSGGGPAATIAGSGDGTGGGGKDGGGGGGGGSVTTGGH